MNYTGCRLNRIFKSGILNVKRFQIIFIIAFVTPPGRQIDFTQSKIKMLTLKKTDFIFNHIFHRGFEAASCCINEFFLIKPKERVIRINSTYFNLNMLKIYVMQNIFKFPYKFIELAFSFKKPFGCSSKRNKNVIIVVREFLDSL